MHCSRHIILRGSEDPIVRLRQRLKLSHSKTMKKRSPETRSLLSSPTKTEARRGDNKAEIYHRKTVSWFDVGRGHSFFSSDMPGPLCHSERAC